MKLKFNLDFIIIFVCLFVYTVKWGIQIYTSLLYPADQTFGTAECVAVILKYIRINHK